MKQNRNIVGKLQLKTVASRQKILMLKYLIHLTYFALLLIHYNQGNWKPKVYDIFWSKIPDYVIFEKLFEIKSNKSKYNHNTLYMIGSDKVLRLVDFDFKFNQNNHHRIWIVCWSSGVEAIICTELDQDGQCCKTQVRYS